MLLLFVAGISLSQAISNPRQVTAHWLRLGGIIAVSFFAVAATIDYRLTHTMGNDHWLITALIASLLITQLITAQLNLRTAQRTAAATGFLVITLVIAQRLTVLIYLATNQPGYPTDLPPIPLLQTSITCGLSAGLLGGFLMTMLLGHAYLSAGNPMTQAPFRRLVLMLAGLLVLRATCSTLLALWPYLTHGSALGPTNSLSRVWSNMILIARYAVGLAVPAVFTYMIYDCVQRRANQSATGILFVATVMIILGEGLALALDGSIGYLF